MKKIILVTVTFFTLVSAYAQRKEGFRVGLDLGVALTSNGGGGVLVSMEPKI